MSEESGKSKIKIGPLLFITALNIVGFMLVIAGVWLTGLTYDPAILHNIKYLPCGSCLVGSLIFLGAGMFWGCRRFVALYWVAMITLLAFLAMLLLNDPRFNVLPGGGLFSQNPVMFWYEAGTVGIAAAFLFLFGIISHLVEIRKARRDRLGRPYATL